MSQNNNESALNYNYTLNEDYKFQSIAAFMVENGIDINDIMLELKGQHQRNFASEIESIDSYPFDKKKVKINLRINGIYDLMPQTYFHDYKKYGNSNIKKMVAESTELRNEEDSFRKLFFPFECFLHRELIEIELKERAIHKRITIFLNKKLFSQDSKNVSDIPVELLERFYYLISFSKLIQKNIKYIQDAFSICIGEKVEININEEDIIEHADSNKLGNEILGVDSICGNSLTSGNNQMNIRIGPIKNWDIENVTVNKGLKIFVDILTEYFIPYFYNVNINYIFNTMHLTLEDENMLNSGVLGYNICI